MTADGTDSAGLAVIRPEFQLASTIGAADIRAHSAHCCDDEGCLKLPIRRDFLTLPRPIAID
jgi:hypothetical protein